MHTLKRAFAATFIVAASTTGFLYLHAEETKPVANEKLKEEYKDVRKQEYLKNLTEKEKYYNTMAEETRAERKACEGNDKDACKKARDHAKETRETLREKRKANNEQFKGKMEEYRKKLGKDAPNPAEKEHKEMKAKKATE